MQSIVLIVLMINTAQIHKELVNIEQKISTILKQDLSFVSQASKFLAGLIMSRFIVPGICTPFWYKFVKYIPGAKRIPNIDTMYKPFHSLVSSCLEIKDKLKDK